MAKSDIINWPTQTTLTGRSSTITSAFIHSITPWLTELTAEQEQEVREIYEEIEKKYRIKILGQDKSDNRCAYCGQPAGSADHIDALVNDKSSSGSITEIYNLLPCCSFCNSSKGKKTFEEWFDLPKTQERMSKIPSAQPNIRRVAIVELISKLKAKSSQAEVMRLHADPQFSGRLQAIYAKRDDINRLLATYEKECRDFAKDIEVELQKMGVTTSSSVSSSSTTPSSTGNAGMKKSKVSDSTYEVAAYYLTHTEGMAAVGTKLLPKPDPNGSKTKSRLSNVGILGEHKGLLIGVNIDDAIANAVNDDLKRTLEEIKKCGLDKKVWL